MHFGLKILTALLCILLAASPAGSGSMLLLGAGAPAAAGGSPVTLTFQAQDAGSGSGNNRTTGATAIGTASSTRRVICLGYTQALTTVPLATSMIGGVTVDTRILLGADTTNSNSHWLISAIVPTGTTAIASVDFATAPGFTVVGFYTTDNSVLVSPTAPVTNSVFSASATALSGTVNTLSGGALLVFTAEAGGSGTPAITTSDETLTADMSFSTIISWHANNVAARTPSHANTSWAAAGSSVLAMVAYR